MRCHQLLSTAARRPSSAPAAADAALQLRPLQVQFAPDPNSSSSSSGKQAAVSWHQPCEQQEQQLVRQAVQQHLLADGWVLLQEQPLTDLWVSTQPLSLSLLLVLVLVVVVVVVLLVVLVCLSVRLPLLRINLHSSSSRTSRGSTDTAHARGAQSSSSKQRPTLRLDSSSSSSSGSQAQAREAGLWQSS
jgi:hypothetical protein